MPENQIYIPLSRWESAFRSIGKDDQAAIRRFEQEYDVDLPFHEDMARLRKLVKENKFLDELEVFINANTGRIILTVPDGELSPEEWLDSVKCRCYGQSIRSMQRAIAILTVLFFVVAIFLKENFF